MLPNSNGPDDKLSTTRKILAGGLVLFAFIFLVAWIWQMNNTFSTFVNSSGGEERSNTSCSDGDCENGQVADKNKDTDGDGLSDWEERNVYNTSPYLKDTDSDGLTDKEEVEQGTDPNCPQEKDCEGQLNNSQEQGKESSLGGSIGVGGNSGSQQSLQTNGAIEAATSGQQMLPQQDLSVENVDKEVLQQLMQGEGDASSLRKALKEAGMDQELLNNLNNEQLMQSYQRALSNMQSNTQ